MPKIRVLIVDDAVVMRQMITEVLRRDPNIEVVGAAANGRIALQKIPQVNPDIVTMDVEMPELDGVATVRELRKLYRRLPVIMLSTLTHRGAEATFEALAAGATDYVTKPVNVGSVTEGIQRLAAELIPRIKAQCRSLLPPTADLALPAAARAQQGIPKRPGSAPRTLRAVCIGTSTGGPNALADVFASLTQPLPVPILIVQHMPPMFTQMLAERLRKISGRPVHEGADGQVTEPGGVYIAPGGKHMEVRREANSVRLRLHEGPPENSCRPAVDVLFRSVASVYGGDALGVIMTGMGQDGLNGCRHLREAGSQILVQDEASSVIWGMPGAVAQAGIADATLPLGQIGMEIARRVQASRNVQPGVLSRVA